MFRASLCTSSGEQDRVLLHMVFCTGCAGCGWLWLCGAWSQAVCTQVATQLHFYLNMFRVSLCTSSGEQDRVLPHMVFCTGCAGCGCVELGRSCVHIACDAAPHNHSQPQPAQPVQNTVCSSTRSCSPNDGHNDARNMLR